MLPVYIAYFAGDNKNPLPNATGFVIGFTLIFVTMGAFAGFVGGFLQDHQMVVNIVAGVFVVVLGFGYLGVFKLPFVGHKGVMKFKRLNFATSIAFGMLFAIAWTPCVSAFLGAALMRASIQGAATGGMLMLFVFSMGLGVPFIISAVLIDRLKTAFDFIKKHHRIVNGIAGGVLIIVGILMMFGVLNR